MKKKNNKGFTMVEILAVITIIGILAAVATPAVYKYLTKARGTSLETMFKSSYEAAENYMMREGIEMASNSDPAVTIYLNDLVNDNYIEALIDPVDKESKCYNSDHSKDSFVVVKRLNGSDALIADYQYKVTIKCPHSGTDTKTFPE